MVLNGADVPADADVRRHPPSPTHLVLIPSFDTGPILGTTIAEARAQWSPVWVVIDGSADGSPDIAEQMAAADRGVQVLRLPRNRGKGAAVRFGAEAARASGFTHALVMDADGQHPAPLIPRFMAASAAAPDALVMGRPQFGADAPWVRVAGRRLSNWCGSVATFHKVGDVLFGFRVYPLADLLAVMAESPGMRGFDFDPEAVVRMAWRGVRQIHLPAPVRYVPRSEGGVSHFAYGRDNRLLAGMHARLLLGGFLRVCRARLGWRGRPGAPG